MPNPTNAEHSFFGSGCKSFAVCHAGPPQHVECSASMKT